MSSSDGPAARKSGIRVGSMREMSERRAEERLELRCDRTDGGVVVEGGVDSLRSTERGYQYWHGRIYQTTQVPSNRGGGEDDWDSTAMDPVQMSIFETQAEKGTSRGLALRAA